MARVTGATPPTVGPRASDARRAIVVGSLDRSPLIQDLVQRGKLDITGVAGQWEAYVVQTVAQPFPGVDEALVIAGADKRGTIYGCYDLSRSMGVSPLDLVGRRARGPACRDLARRRSARAAPRRPSSTAASSSTTRRLASRAGRPRSSAA